MIERAPASARLPLDDAGAIRVAVVMERTALANRWQPFRWAPVAIVPGIAEVTEGSEASAGSGVEKGPSAAGPAQSSSAPVRTTHPGYEVRLYRDEAEGYYLNVSSPVPAAFVNWELVDERPHPHSVTLSYNEAARMMDGGAQVDSVPLPAEIAGWLAAYVEQHYRPEPKKQRIRPPSFKGARRGEGTS